MEIRKYLLKYKWSLFVFIMFSILSSVISAVVPFFNGRFIDSLITSSDFDDIVGYILIIIPLILCGTLTFYLSNLFSIKLSSRASYDNLSDTLAHLQKVPYDVFLSRFNPAYLVKRVSSDIETVYNFVVSNLVNIMMQLVLFIIGIAVISSINLLILIVSIIFIPIYIICYILMKKPLFDRELSLKENQSILYQTINDEMANVQQIKVDVDFDKSKQRGYESFHTYYRSLISLSKIKYVFSSLDNIIGLLFQSVVIVLSGILIVNGEMTVGEFTIVNSYFIILLASIKYYFNLGKSYQDFKASSHRLNELENIHEEHNGSKSLDSIDCISVDRVSFRYPGLNNLAVSETCVTLRKDEITVIMGPNGSGKTTLFNIIIGLFQNLYSGTVRYDDLCISDVDLYSVRSNLFSSLLQNNHSRTCTVGSLLKEQLDIDINEVPHICSIMGLEDLFSSDQFDLTDHFGKKINELSGGERQRVNLFVTLAQQKPIILLDEPTNALDAKAKRALIEYLSKIKSGRIIVIISHDENLSAIADNTLYLYSECKNNPIVESVEAMV